MAAVAPAAGDTARMTQAKLDVFTVGATLARGQVGRLAERHWDPDIVLEEPEALPDGANYRGREAAARRLNERMLLGHEASAEIVAVHDPGGDEVLAEMRVTLHPEAGGAAIDFPWFQLATVRDGRVVRLREFTEREAAFEAAGLDGG